MAEKRIFLGTGRRKSSIAQVKMVPGKGKITVNGTDVRDFFPYETNVMDLKQPLVLTQTEETFDIDVKVLFKSPPPFLITILPYYSNNCNILLINLLFYVFKCKSFIFYLFSIAYQ